MAHVMRIANLRWSQDHRKTISFRARGKFIKFLEIYSQFLQKLPAKLLFMYNICCGVNFCIHSDFLNKKWLNTRMLHVKLNIFFIYSPARTRARPARPTCDKRVKSICIVFICLAFRVINDYLINSALCTNEFLVKIWKVFSSDLVGFLFSSYGKSFFRHIEILVEYAFTWNIRMIHVMPNIFSNLNFL